MADAIEPYLQKTISVITKDGSHIVGTLKGYDQFINVVLNDSHERVYSQHQGVEKITLGLYVIRGDNIAVVGLLDEDIDDQINLDNVKADPLDPIEH